MLQLLLSILILATSFTCASVQKYLVLGVNEESDIGPFLSALILEDGADRNKITFSHRKDHAILSLNLPSLFSQDPVELFFVRNSKSLTSSLLVRIIRWLDYGGANGIIFLDQDIQAYDSTMVQLFVPADTNSIHYFYLHGQRKYLVLGGAEYSWYKNVPSASQITDIRDRLKTTKPIRLVDIKTTKRAAQFFADESLIERPNFSASLYRRVFDFSLGLLFPVDLLSFSILRGHMDIIAYLMRPLAPFYQEALSAQIPGLAEFLSLQQSTEERFLQKYEALGFASLYAQSSLTRFKKFSELSEAKAKGNVLVSLLPEQEHGFSLFEIVIAGKFNHVDDQLFVNLLARYLHWCMVAEFECQDERALAHLHESMRALKEFITTTSLPIKI